MATTVAITNYRKPAPKWFRKLKKATGILTVAANVMIAQWTFKDPAQALKLQLWCTIGIGAVLEAVEAILADDEVVNPDNPGEHIQA